MFQNRRTSQKPDDELYAAFKQSFPEVGPGTSSGSAQPGAAQRSASLSEAILDAPTSHRPFSDIEGGKDHDETPKPLHDTWRLTPSLMDPNSYAFNAFLNQPPGYYTPTPGGINTLYHSQAGDLHTPGMGMNTPLSMPHSVHGISAHDGSLDLQHFQPHFLHNPQQFHPGFAQQPTYAPPSHFLQQHDSGYVAMEGSSHKTTPTSNEMHMPPPMATQSITQQINAFMGVPGIPSGERFRFHTTLNAPTAMIRHADEIPVTYLNKGQAYTVSIFDTNRPPPSAAPVKYRTYIRISFEDEQQRARPGACWQLWKEGRGSNEAHQRGGKLLAVEYVDPNQGGDEEIRKSNIELEKASFDGFAVTWTPNSAHGAPDCSVSVRFNFLSTDFSHSKGVKGIPVRLCSKTELVSSVGDDVSQNESEVCFSKVKLFRDHGAERKLSNDVAHVKKTIDKLKQQISQAESGMGTAGKRKRSGSLAKASASRPGKVIKHKRTWSIDSEGDTGRLSAEEDLQLKLVGMQDMFSSTRPVSVLYLKGEPGDDPDDYPVTLTGEGQGIKLSRTTTWESRQSAGSSPTSNAGSPTSSSASTTSPKRKYSEIQQASIPEESGHELDESGQMSTPTSPLQAVKIPKRDSAATPRSSLLALDVDSTYQPPSERPIKPVACFYVRSRDAVREYYRAVYLMHRTVKDLINSISDKFGIEPHRVTQVTHINSRGLHIIVDEDVVRELPEGQDMIVEFAPLQPDRPVKPEFVAPDATEVITDANFGSADAGVSDYLEMWLNY